MGLVKILFLRHAYSVLFGWVLVEQAGLPIPSVPLMLAAGTMTDVNGATNFTEQFAVNGQRGVEAVFAMDGADTSDPEMGGAAFSNFNVDAIEEIRSSSGWMPSSATSAGRRGRAVGRRRSSPPWWVPWWSCAWCGPTG